MRQFIRTTVLGGIVFLVPLVVLGLIVAKAFEIAARIARPLARLIPAESWMGIALLDAMAIVLLLAVCLVAGLVARTTAAARVVQMLEDNLLAHIPAYTFVKGMVSSVASEQTETMTPVLVALDDAAMVGYEVERLEDGRVVVYTPGAPNPWSGSVSIVEPERVRALDVTMVATLPSFRRLGQGTARLLE